MMLRYEMARRGLRLMEGGRSGISEIEIQARLYAGEFGTGWQTLDGRHVEVLHFGEWNREAGPDFRDARVRFDDGPERVGDIEVDPEIRDWDAHGHASNPAYNGVVLQLFLESGGPAFFARTSENTAVAQARLDIEISRPRPLRHIPGLVDRDTALRMIDEAAEFRLQRKQSAHARAVTLHGAEGALFQAVAVAMGYKNNSIPFLLAAQRAGLRGAAGADGEARLFGLAGFLEPRTFDDGDPATREYLRPLWEEWWTLHDGLRRLVIPRTMWRFAGVRPSNHPHRRLGAFAVIARDFSGLRRAIRDGGRAGFEEYFEKLAHPYWNRHWNLPAARLNRDLALVGADRIRDLVVNALLPSFPLEKAREELKRIPGPYPAGVLVRACEWLTGSDRLAGLRTAWHQQGLLQLYKDFGSLTALEAWGKIQGGAT